MHNCATFCHRMLWKGWTLCENKCCTGFESQLDSSAAQPEAMNATTIYLSKFPNPTATSPNVDHIILPQERGLNFKLFSFKAIKALTRFEPMPAAP